MVREMMRRIGVHTSIAGGLYHSLERAMALGCNTMQIFSHNPRGWAVKKITEEESLMFQSLRSHLNISPVYIHASYLINLASRNKDLQRKSINLLVTEMARADVIGAEYVILHPGSAPDDEHISRKRTIVALNEVSLRERWKAGLIIENTAGERGDIFFRIIHLSEIINAVKGSFIKGICIDTCHAFAAGYDIRSDKGIEEITEEIKCHIGLDKLKVIHLNDSKGDLGSGIDRHEHIGLGKIGIKGLKKFINHPPFRYIPLILETPKKQESDDLENLKRVREMILK